VLKIDTADDLVTALATLRSDREVELRISLQLTDPVDDLMPQPGAPDASWLEPSGDVVEALRNAGTALILAGPGVVWEAAVPGLHDLAVKGNLGVLNTWGAKGVFDWRSRHHLATVGLQEGDFTLGGLGDVGVIIATGLDPLEAPDQRWRLAPSYTVLPSALGPLAEKCRSKVGEIMMPPLRNRLAGVTQRGWAAVGSPLPPTRVTKHYAECLSTGAMVAADAGIAGFWVARTLGTTRLGGVIVPSSSIPGFAAACVAVSQLRQPDRPALAIVDGSDADQTATVVDAALSLGIHVPVETWDPDGEPLDADAHRARLQKLLSGKESAPSGVQSLATDQNQLAEMIDAAGAIVAWR
jgi:hypothetical protein